MCMHVVYVYVCLCTQSHPKVIYIYMYIGMFMCVYPCIYVPVYCIHASVYVHIHVCILTMCMWVCMHIYVYPYMCAYTHTHTHTHTHTQEFLELPLCPGAMKSHSDFQLTWHSRQSLACRPSCGLPPSWTPEPSLTKGKADLGMSDSHMRQQNSEQLPWRSLR